MKKAVWFLLFSALMVLSAGCTSNGGMNEKEPKMLNVDLSVTPEKGKINTPITFKAKVTYGEEKVKDANEVSFEIWRSKDKQHEKIKIHHEKDGIYRLDKSFSKEGTYYIVSHVTARGMHNMPKKEFVIGTPSDRENSSNSMSGMDNMKMDMGGKDNSHKK
ncbi:MAG: FixH family protein [Bacillota bacterium]|nr:FixH family protein [Bacillota bacterium]